MTAITKILSKRNFKSISDKVDKKYDNFILENLNADHCLRMSVMEEAYRWHYHDNMDELFIVLKGVLQIEIRNQETVFIHAGEFIKIPSKTIHKTSAIGRTVNLCFEKDADDTIFVE